MNDLISVIVPVYNVEKYLRQCLTSLVNQTYKNIEVVMVDDGSKDSSGLICDEYAINYQNFSVVHKKNAGLGMARNTGLDNIKGKYVFFLDSDDYIDNNFIEVLYKNLLKSKVDMCKGGFKKFTDSDKVIFERKFENKIYYGNKAKTDLLPRMIGSSPFAHDSIDMGATCTLYNTDIIKKHGVKFHSEREFISEDLVFNIDYMQYADGACTVSEAGYYYRVNLKSLTTSYRPDRFEACKYLYLEMQKKLTNLGYDEDTLLRLDRAFFVYLRMCIRQEKVSASKEKKDKLISNIEKICQDQVVIDVINNYPTKYLGVSQRLFLKLIKDKHSKILYMLAKSEKL